MVLQLYASCALTIVFGYVLISLLLTRRRRAIRGQHQDQEKAYDYVIVGGGPSGLYLAKLLSEKFPRRSICLINKDGAPPNFPWKYYMVNLIGVVFPSLIPRFIYKCKTVNNQFANCTYLGGSSNINAAVAPLPTKEEIVSSLSVKFGDYFDLFSSGGHLDFLSEKTPSSTGLAKLSSDLRKLGIPGGQIRALKRGFKRIHPADFVTDEHLNVHIEIGLAKKVLFDEKKTKALTVVVEYSQGLHKPKDTYIHSKRSIILCCGAIESPKLLIRSGCGPKALLSKLMPEEEFVQVNDSIGQNLQDHWVTRVQAVLPVKYSYPRLYPCILGYKHKFGNVAIGFGKLQLAGRNLFSIATTKCRAPGGIIYRDNELEPYLPLGREDEQDLKDGVHALRNKLKQIGIELSYISSKISPNWHLACSLSLGDCVDDKLKVEGIDNLYCSDLSVLQNLVPMNTQIVSYFIAFAFAQIEE